MLKQTFLHVPGVGSGTEQRLWNCGIRNWEDALEMPPDAPISPRTRAKLETELPRSAASLAAGDAAHFAGLSRYGEAWRLYGEFASSCLYLDIETNGGWGEEERLTVVGVRDGEGYTAYIADENLEELPDRVAQAKILVTFNGANFDVPALRRLFRRCRLPRAHIDLRFAAQKAGLRGGLKRIEEKLGLDRPKAIRGLDGWDAVRLWNEYLRGSQDALQQLIAYNRADVENLKPLMEWTYQTLRRARGHGSSTAGRARHATV